MPPAESGAPADIARVRASFCAASVMGLPFAGYLLVARWVAAPGDAEWARADPITRLLPHAVTLAGVPALGILAAVVWVRSGALPRARVARTLAEAAIGVAAASGIVFGLRLLWGPHVPPFVPPEESAAPGFLLNVTAGYGEEVLFRLGLLPVLYLALARRAPRPVAIGVAVAVTALGFALLHQPASSEWSRTLFVSRLLLPGGLMSTAALTRSATFIVVAHCTAHLLIPIAFTG